MSQPLQSGASEALIWRTDATVMALVGLAHAMSHFSHLLLPGLFVAASILAFNFLGDGLRDAADPYTV